MNQPFTPINPFQAHVAGLAQLETILASATLSLFGLTFPCTHTEIVKDFQLIPGGQSPTTFVERCEFRVALIGANVPSKGIYCVLQPNPTAAPVNLMLWHGGLQPGGLIFRFMLVDRNYKG